MKEENDELCGKKQTHCWKSVQTLEITLINVDNMERGVDLAFDLKKVYKFE